MHIPYGILTLRLQMLMFILILLALLLGYYAHHPCVAVTLQAIGTRLSTRERRLSISVGVCHWYKPYYKPAIFLFLLKIT